MSSSQAFEINQTYISIRPGYCGGEPCITGHRIKVRHVYVWYELMGLSDRKIADDYSLSLSQVHAALAYAYDHIEDIREAIRAADELVEEMTPAYPSKIPPRYLSDDD